MNSRWVASLLDPYFLKDGESRSWRRRAISLTGVNTGKKLHYNLAKGRWELLAERGYTITK